MSFAGNVLSSGVLLELNSVLDQAVSNPPRALVVISGKKSGFIAGADIKEFTGITDAEEGFRLIHAGQEVLNRLEALPCPTVAAIHGFALGGGLELALACRYRVAVNDEKQYRALMTGLGRPDVFDDPRFIDWFQRKAHEAQLREIIEDALAAEDSKIWERRLNDAGAPCASIWKVEEIIDHPQIIARGAMQSVDSKYGPLRLMGSGFQMAHGGGRLDTLAPEPGADTDHILADIGYDAAAIEGFRVEGVV